MELARRGVDPRVRREGQFGREQAIDEGRAERPEGSIEIEAPVRRERFVVERVGQAPFPEGQEPSAVPLHARVRRVLESHAKTIATKAPG